MLKDYGKSLFKPWVSVQNTVLLMVLIFIAALLKLTSSELASWVQAIGSIAAIWGALKVNQMQQENVQKYKVAESIAMAESHAVLVREAGKQCAIIAIAVGDVEHIKFYKQSFLVRYNELFRITLLSMESVSIRDLGSPLMVSLHLQMTSTMAEMYKNIQRVIDTDNGEIETLEKLYDRLEVSNIWYQTVLVGFDKAIQEKIDSITAFDS